jgi:hypothetical protein
VKHTPEPWLVDPDEPTIHAIDRRVLIADCRVTQVAATRPPREPGVDDANADRIVACVNACAGIADPADLRRQRDELLAILSRLTEKVERANSIQHSGGEILEEDWAELYQLANESRAAIAIANAEPQPKE